MRIYKIFNEKNDNDFLNNDVDFKFKLNIKITFSKRDSHI